jgi:hypothetical protein
MLFKNQFINKSPEIFIRVKSMKKRIDQHRYKKATSFGGLFALRKFVFVGLHLSASQGECRLFTPTDVLSTSLF